MTVDLILHGVPNGQDIWGVSDDTHYISTFYVQKDEREYLSIEARKVAGKSYCYYNFLKYNGVTASDERAGAYIGITLRFDAYYKDVLNVYHLCEIVYNNLLDKILVKNGDNVKFKIAKFEDAEQELTEIKKKMFNLLDSFTDGRYLEISTFPYFTNACITFSGVQSSKNAFNVLASFLKKVSFIGVKSLAVAEKFKRLNIFFLISVSSCSASSNFAILNFTLSPFLTRILSRRLL